MKGNFFKQVPVKSPKRNMFDLSHEVKMSGKFGNLYPILCKEVLPGDTWINDSTVMMRFAPMLAPIMHRLDVTVHFFAVPNRLLCPDKTWENFITGGQDGDFQPVLPYYPVNQIVGEDAALCQKGSLWDYFGLPVLEGAVPAVVSAERISALPFRAYAKIWSDYYRDPNFDDEIIFEPQEGNVFLNDFQNGILSMRQRGFEKDMYTSALPFAQRGLEVLMPISGTATAGDITYYANSRVRDIDGTFPSPDTYIGNTTSGNMTVGKNTANPASGALGRIENIASVEFSQSATSINDFRRAIAIQGWLENNARGGARYTEQILHHFAVRVPDYRLQRAEYLGGGKQPVTISEVLSTTQNADASIGEMAGHGISVGRSNRFKYYAQEHMIIVGIMSVMPRTAYQQGIDRMWTRQDKFDYAWHELAHIGEQELLSKELFYSFDADATADNNATFGYIPRYSEYKFQNDRVAGDFRDTLGFWHLGRKFTSRPSLDALFTTMYENGETGEETFRRIFANQDGTDYLWVQIYHNLKAIRPLPYFGIPNVL